MYVLCFTGFFRFDDISRVRRSDISFHVGFMVIQVHNSRNDQRRKGNEEVISELSSPSCPVTLLKRYLDKFHIPSNLRDLISKGKGFCKLFSPGKPISYSCIRDGFRCDLKNIGVDPLVRSSFLPFGCGLAMDRPYFSTSWPLEVCCGKNAYVNDSIEQRLSVSKFLGL